MAMILDAFGGKLVDRLAEFVEERVVTVLGVKDEVKRLLRRMERIKLVLRDAERKRIQSEAVAGWVRELKDVVYDADDIIDRCRFEGGKLLDDQPSASTASRSVRCNFISSLSCFSSLRFRHEIGDKIKNLNQRLKEIIEDMSDLNLMRNEPDNQVTMVNPRQTTPLVDPSDIVGGAIKHATEDLVERIAKKEGEQKCRVFAITGMGGIGKTTLAQNIFNHQKIKSEFSDGQKIWVCISQNFSETNLLKEIIRGAKGSHGDLQTKAELLPLLQNIISGKPLFLVLDDVWRADIWDDLLRHPLQIGAICSRILITTRDQNVAMQMRTVHTHRVEQLPLESGWELLSKILFSSSQEEEIQGLRDVGIEIVRKCHGLPLAIKAIAGVLTTKGRSRGEWEKVLRRDAWSMDKLPDDLRGALYLSYEDLPSHLKQCFVFCSLFPEDHVFSRRDLVMYWVVEGFVETQRDSFSKLEQADEYFEGLVRRNLIQKEYYDDDDDDDDERYKMHDLLRSLAQFLSQDESFCGEAHELTMVSTTTKLRRLIITDKGELEVIPEPLLQHKSLRTLFLKSCPSLGNNLFVGFPFLRLLLLSDSAIENIPDAVGNLIHLRLLDLDRTKISNLPESIRSLTNLEVLYLSDCRSLDTLPNGITRLCNLCFLDLHGTPLSFIPAGMGSLKQLNILSGLVLGGDRSGQQGCSLEDLKPLSQLRELSIYNLERAVVAQKGQMVLRDKPHLKRLELYCTEPTAEHTNEIEEEFAELFPPPCLQVLKIDGYFGRGFPGWMMSASLGSFLPQLTTLTLYDCENVSQLPPLGLLPELRHLTIRDAATVVTIGPEFLGSSATSVAFFPKLENLEFFGMFNLEEWSFCGEKERLAVLPHLQKLEIYFCPKLESLPRGLKQSPLTRMDITRCGSLEWISDLPALKELIIHYCPMLKSVGKVDALKRLDLNDRNIECLPEWLLRLLQQRQQQMKEKEQQQDDDFRLQLWINDRLLKRCLMGCEYWPIIRNVPSVKARSNSSFDAGFKYTKKPFNYSTRGLCDLI